MAVMPSLSFLHCAFPSSQQLSLPSNFVTLRTNSLPSIESTARTRRDDRSARHSRIRKKVEGTPERPRLCVFRSNKHLYVQVIDDTKMHTLASASTMQKPISEEIDYSSGPTICFKSRPRWHVKYLPLLQLWRGNAERLLEEVARKIGEVIAKNCLGKGITKVAFDRGGYPYHGRIQAIADAAREHGLKF